MVQALHLVENSSTPLPRTFAGDLGDNTELNFELPDPQDDQVSDYDFQQQIETAWQVCDRFDLQTEIWRGRILRTVRDRQKRGGDERGAGFLKWLQDREISKSQAYSLIELANSADALLQSGMLEVEDVKHFSKRAFVETAQASPEVQQLVSEAVQRGDRMTRRDVRQLSDEWTAVTSDLLPIEIKEKAANHSVPARYLTPLVKEMAKLPESHQNFLRSEIAENPEIETVKQVTAEAHYLAKYLTAATQVQIFNHESIDLEAALEEALRLGCLSSTADLVNNASQLEQTAAKLYTTWKRLNTLAERVFVDSGESTPHLRSLLSCLAPLTNNTIEVNLGEEGTVFSHPIRLKILTDDSES